MIDECSIELSFCPSLKVYREVILLTCAVFPTAAPKVAVGNCAAIVAVVDTASTTLVTTVASDT